MGLTGNASSRLKPLPQEKLFPQGHRPPDHGLLKR